MQQAADGGKGLSEQEEKVPQLVERSRAADQEQAGRLGAEVVAGRQKQICGVGQQMEKAAA